MEAIWTRACDLLKERIGNDVFDRWIMPIQVVSLSQDQLVLGVDNTYFQMILTDNYLSYIDDAVKASGGDKLKISIEVMQGIAEVPVAPQPIVTRKQRTISQKHAPSLNPEFTFESFVTGPSNLWSWTATKATAENPGTSSNPLFIYGPTGVGKTHLLQSAGNLAFKRYPQMKIIYITSESLLNEYITAISSQTQVEFRRKYRTIDMLLIDDIQFLAGKSGLQEEFFHMFNALQMAHKQIIMTSDQPPREIKGLEERLVSRFQTGVGTELEYPTFETRLAILKYKNDALKNPLSSDILTFIAENVQSSVRALEGALTRASSFVSLSAHGTILTIEVLRELIKDLITNELTEELTCEAIQKVVAEHFNIKVSDILSPVRSRNLALPRQVAMYMCRKLTRDSLPEIAKNFDKTHATVLHGCKQVQNAFENDSEMRITLNTIASKLGKDLNVV